MRIFLSGSGGFIGGALKKYLQKKYDILAPRSCELDLQDSVSVENFFDKNDVDFIIHCGAKGVRVEPNASLEDVAKPNIAMFKNLAKFAGKKTPMIVFGSGAEYDKSRNLCKIKEEDFGKNIPKDAYGFSKYMISKEIEKLDYILNLRIFGIYGVGENPSRVTSCIVNDNLNKRPIMLNQNVLFDFLYIDDLCAIVERFISRFPNQKFLNATPTNSIETEKLAQIINEISDYKSEIIFKKSGMNLEYTADNSKLLSALGDFKFTSYNHGMQDFFKKLKALN